MALSRVLCPDTNRSIKRLWSPEPSRRFKMNASHRASVSFTDVAASFSEEEWDLLEEWQRDLYGNVMREIHNVLQDLGYHIENSEILFRITRNNELTRHSHSSPGSLSGGLSPEILLRINYEGERMISSEIEDSVEGSRDMKNVTVCPSDLFQKIKQEDDLYSSPPYESQTEESCHQYTSPVTAQHCPTSPVTNQHNPTSPVLPAGEPSYSLDVKDELTPALADCDGSTDNLITAHKTNTEWNPNKIQSRSKSPSSGEAPEPVHKERVRRRKGIARQIKPVAALHDSDQNKQTEPKENEEPRHPRLFTECDSSFSPVKLPFSSDHQVEEAYPYTPYSKSIIEDAPLSFQQRGQTFIVCSVCGKTFCNNSSFQVHMRTHTGERPYKCSECEKSFIRSSHLKIHMRTHTGERPYKCPDCEKSFRDNSSFARHLRIHTGEKPYQCPMCGKYFRKKSNLKDHQRTHTGERPYKCRHCDKSFHQKSNLRVHERNHHIEDS